MSGLSALKFTNSKRQQDKSPQHARRQKLCSKLDEQILLAKAEQSGTPFTPTKLRIVKDETTGETRKVETPKKLKPWWWKDDKGKLCITMRYGARTLEIIEGKSSVEAGSIAEVVSSLQVIRIAVQSGELDSRLGMITVAKKPKAEPTTTQEKRSTLRLPSRSS
jgi:hypothetical protein